MSDKIENVTRTGASPIAVRTRPTRHPKTAIKLAPLPTLKKKEALQ